MKNILFGCVFIAMMSFFPSILSYYRIFYILIGLTFALALALAWSKSVESGRLRKNGRMLGIFFGYLALTAVWAAVPQRTLLEVAIGLVFILVWALAYILQVNFEEKDVARIFLGVPYAVALTFAYLLLKYGALRPYDENTAIAFGATANLSAQWLTASLPFILWLLRRGDKKRIFESVLTILLIAVSQSRTGYFLAAFCIVAEIRVRASGFRHFFGEAAKWAAVLVLLFTLVLMFPGPRDLIRDGITRTVTTEDPNEEYLDLERVWMLQEGWNSFVEHPVLGIGYGNLGERIEETYGYVIVSHNILITLIAEAGWPGFVIFVLLLVGFFKKASLARSQGDDAGYYTAAMISMSAALLSGLAYPLLQFPLFYFVLGIGYAAKRRPEYSRAQALAQPLLITT